VVIRFSIVPIFDGDGTLGIILAMGIILAIELYYSFISNKHKKESLWLLGGLAGITLITFIIHFFVKLNLNYIAISTVILSALYWGIIEIVMRYKRYVPIILISIGGMFLSFSADYIFNNVLQHHQQIRIKVLLNMEQDPHGAGYNVNQSKIAIGSGGFLGKGYLNGTQTKLKYVPEQDTDFIFCTVGEEWGFWGSATLLMLYWWLLMRVIKIAERQRESFNRIYGYGVASILFFHLMINIGMVIGIMPVIGIPLPFLSYGGSSLWSFTVLLFILLRLDTSRLERGFKSY
jgi:rod shape determining protein RodA